MLVLTRGRKSLKSKKTGLKMNDYLPDYRRGESIVGYQTRCASGRMLQQAVPGLANRIQICKEHALQMRVALGQRFENPGRR